MLTSPGRLILSGVFDIELCIEVPSIGKWIFMKIRPPSFSGYQLPEPKKY